MYEDGVVIAPVVAITAATISFAAVVVMLPGVPGETEPLFELI